MENSGLRLKENAFLSGRCGIPASIERLFGRFRQKSAESLHSDRRQDPVEPLHPRVLMIVHDPPVESEGGRRLSQVFRWHEAMNLANGYINDLRHCSGGYLQYRIVEQINADWYPSKEDGFRYTSESFLQAWRAHKQPNEARIDYPAQIRAFELERRHRDDEFDEVWFFTFPYAGDYESTMAGPGAFWCNSPPVPGTSHFRSRFVIMAFNYERGVDCMLENFGHRAESIMRRVYQQHRPDRNMWERFIQYEKVTPNQAQCGNVHFAPNSEKDYDWGNKRHVTSYCDDWLTYPDLPGNGRTMTCADWGDGEMRQHHLWWLSHLPKAPGESEGVANNWWRYIVDPNLVQ